MKYLLICIYLFIISIVHCHSINNKQLLRVEPVTSIKLDIASRPAHFYEKRDISANDNYLPHAKSLQYDDTLRLSLSAFNKSLFLHLTPNVDLFHPNAVIHQNGISTKLNPADYRVYRGYVIDDFFTDHWWISGLLEESEIMEKQPGVLGWARIVVRHDIKHDLDHPLFEGAFSLNGDIYHIKLTENYHLTKRADDVEFTEDAHMIIYRDSDTILASNFGNEKGSDCGFDALTHQQNNGLSFREPGVDSLTALFNPNHHLTKRAPTGCPTSQRVLYMGVAADCTYVKYYQNSDNARTQIINDWNSVSSVYTSTFNVGLGLINITLMDAMCPPAPVASTNWNQACSTSYSISSRLSDFSRWRGNIGNDGAGLWHLMTDCATGPEVGIAWLGQVCNTGAVQSSSSGEYTSGTGVSSIIRDEWKVVAHEIGHGFGAIHDCTATTCPCSGRSCNCCPYSDTQCDAGGLYFMNPTSNASSSAFSPCSISTICGGMSQFTSCLEAPGSRTVTTLQMCGNGIVESGEQCDTGGVDTACCDAATCKFKTGATCDDTNDLCCNNCQVRPANYTCRPSSGECDIAEVCDGVSAKCPDDKFKDDLTTCSNGLQCASGQCTSRDVQCRARGVSYNITKACGGIDNGCSIDCQYGSALSCIQFPGYFIDGTPCGVGGVCKSGKCNTDNFGNNVKSWIDTHLAIFIPVVVVVGLLVLCCLFSCFCYNGRSAGYTKTTEIYVPQQQQYYMPPPPPPQPQGWVDPSIYNGPGQYQPQQPLPAYSQRDPMQDSYEMNRTNQWQNNNSTPPPPPNLPPHQQQRPHNEGII